MVSLTLQQIIDFAEKNGYPWGKGSDRWDEFGLRASFCVLEQVTINAELDVETWGHIAAALNKLEDGLGTDIYMYNDMSAKTYDDAVEFLRYRLMRYDLSTEIMFDLYD